MAPFFFTDRETNSILLFLWPLVEKLKVCFQFYLFVSSLPSITVVKSSCFHFCEFPLAVAATENNPIPAKTTNLLIMYATFSM